MIVPFTDLVYYLSTILSIAPPFNSCLACSELVDLRYALSFSSKLWWKVIRRHYIDWWCRWLCWMLLVNTTKINKLAFVLYYVSKSSCLVANNFRLFHFDWNFAQTYATRACVGCGLVVKVNVWYIQRNSDGFPHFIALQGEYQPQKLIKSGGICRGYIFFLGIFCVPFWLVDNNLNEMWRQWNKFVFGNFISIQWM